MIKFTKEGVTFEDPTKRYVIFGSRSGYQMFDPNTQLKEAVHFLKSNLSDISFVFLGEAGDYMHLPDLYNRISDRWIGFACTDKCNYDFDGTDLLQIMQDIPKGTHVFYVYRA